jgi:methionine salvage enolase-phosphatase E1
MSRPKKKEIKFSKDSILSILQEIYNELVEQRNTAIRIQNKMLSMMKDSEDMQTIGPVIKEQQKIINDCVEKKLSLSKLQSSIWEKSQNDAEDFTLGDLDDDLVQSIINRDVENTDNIYKLNK